MDSNPKTGILCQTLMFFLDLHTLPVTVNILRHANDSEQQQEDIWQSEGARCILIQKLASYDKPSSSSGNAHSPRHIQYLRRALSDLNNLLRATAGSHLAK